MWRYSLLSISLAVLAVSGASAGSVDLGLGNEAAWVAFDWSVAGGKVDLGPSWLHHQDEGDVVSFGVLRVDTPGDSDGGSRVGVGGRFFYLGADDADGYALAIGGFVDYRFPGRSRVGLGGRAYFAPDVAAFGDAHKYVEAELRVTYNIFDEGQIWLGYTFAEAEFENRPNINYNSGLLLGFRFRF